MESLRRANAKAALPVEDLARARAFYEEKLGLTPSREVEGALFYQGSGDSGFLLFPTGGRPSGQHTQMAWFVKDIAATVASSEAVGSASRNMTFRDSKPSMASPISDTRSPPGSRTVKAISLRSASSS